MSWLQSSTSRFEKPALTAIPDIAATVIITAFCEIAINRDQLGDFAPRLLLNILRVKKTLTIAIYNTAVISECTANFFKNFFRGQYPKNG
jgi:hypothetical protein